MTLTTVRPTGLVSRSFWPTQEAKSQLGFDDVEVAAAAAGVERVLRSGWLTLGPETEAFEGALAELLGTRHTVAVNSGTGALQILVAATCPKGTDVIVPANTFPATIFAVMGAGARPVVADVDPVSMVMTAETVEAAWTDTTSGVAFVHIGGMVGRHALEVAALCRTRGTAFVEDAAHAFLSRGPGGEAVGTLGAGAAFSFYPTKPLTTGEGGVIATDDGALAATARTLRNQGKGGVSDIECTMLGSNWRMSEFAAAIGRALLPGSVRRAEARREVAVDVAAAVQRSTWLTQPADDLVGRSSYYRFIAHLPAGCDRALARASLAAAGIPLQGEVYSLPIPDHGAFASPGALVVTGEYPGAARACSRHLCLPVSTPVPDVGRLSAALDDAAVTGGVATRE